MRRMRFSCLMVLIMTFFVFPSLSVSAAKTRELLDEEKKPFATMEIDDSWILKKADYTFYDGIYAYAIYDSKTQEEIADIEICASEDAIIEMKGDDRDYEYTEKKTKHNLTYLSERGKKEKCDSVIVTMDKDRHIIVLYAFHPNQELADRIINSIRPIDGDRFEDPDQPILELSQKSHTRNVMSSIGLSLCFVWLFSIIGKYKMFPKMGLHRAKAIIPVYSEYLIFKKVWNRRMFFVYFILMSGFVIGDTMENILPAGNPLGENMGILSLAATIVLLFIAWIFASWIARSFGKGEKFALLVMLCQPVAYIILGFSKAEYIGNAYQKYNDELKNNNA